MIKINEIDWKEIRNISLRDVSSKRTEMSKEGYFLKSMNAEGSYFDFNENNNKDRNAKYTLTFIKVTYEEEE